MGIDAPEPLSAAAWIDRLRREVFADEIGASDWPAFERHRSRIYVLLRALTDDSYAGWCDRVDSPATETCEQVLPERSRFVQSTGQSGDRRSRRHGDMVERWARVESIPMRMDRTVIEGDSVEVLRLRPR